MQIENYTIATTVEEIRDLVQHCILNNFTGRINLTISGAEVKVWQPENLPIAESVTNPKHISMERFPATDEHFSDNCTH
jgi:hypothetical protein